MAVAVDTGSIQVFAGRLDTNPSPLYQEKTCALSALANACLVCIISKPGSTQGNIVAPRMNPAGANTAMTLAEGWSSVANNVSAIYYSVLGGSYGGGNIVVRVANSVYTATDCKFTAFALGGVDQGSPVGTAVKNSSGGGSSPWSDSATCGVGGMLIAAHMAANSSGSSMAPLSGQTALSAVDRIDGTWDCLHSYDGDPATGMGMSWSGGAAQLSNLIVPFNAAVGGGGGNVGALIRSGLLQSALNLGRLTS